MAGKRLPGRRIPQGDAKSIGRGFRRPPVADFPATRGPVAFGFRTASKILAGPSGPTAVFSWPETEIDPVQWVPINDLWYYPCHRMEPT